MPSSADHPGPAFNKSINEATSSMAHLSSTNKHDTTVGDKDSNEKRIEVSKESRSNESITYEKTINESSSVIPSVASCSGSSLSCTSFNNEGANHNFFGNQCNSIGFVLIGGITTIHFKSNKSNLT